MSFTTSWFGSAEEDAPTESKQKDGAKQAPHRVDAAHVSSQTFEEQSWYHCLWPDAILTEEQPNDIIEDSRQDDANASDAEQVAKDKVVIDKQQREGVVSTDQDGNQGTALNDTEHLRTRSMPPPTKEREEILPESTHLHTGSFESISALSLESYGTAASTMLGGMDYDENDEKVLNTFLSEKEDESVVGGETGVINAAPPTSIPICERIGSCKSKKEEGSAPVSDQDTTRNNKGNEETAQVEHDSEYTEEASRMSMDTRRLSRMSSSAPLKQIKLMLKGGKANDAEKMRMVELRSAIKSFGRHDINVAHTLMSTGDFYVSVSDYEQALSLHEEAFSIYSTKLGDHDPRSVDSKVRIAQVQLLQGRIEEAMETFCQTLHMRSALLGEEHPSVSEVRMHVAEIQRGKGHPKEAAKEIKKALKGYREVYGDDHPLVADAVEDIAELYTEMGEHDKANLILSEIVKLRASISGSDSPAVAKALMKWGWSFEATGNPTRAIKLMKQAYAAFVKFEGIAGLNTAEALDGVGKLYAKLGRKDKAIKAYTRVLNIRRQVQGESHPQTAASFVTIGKTLKDSGQPAKAMKCMRRAMSIYADCKKSDLDKDSTIAITDSLHQIGLTFEELGEHLEAHKAFSRELSMRKSTAFQDRRRIARAMNAIGVIQCKRGKFKSALDFFLEALLNMDATIGRNATFAATLFNVGLTLEKMGETEEAYQAYADTLIIYRKEGLREDNAMVDKVISKLKKKPNIQVDVVDVDRTNDCKLPCSFLDNKTTSEC